MTQNSRPVDISRLLHNNMWLSSVTDMEIRNGFVAPKILQLIVITRKYHLLRMLRMILTSHTYGKYFFYEGEEWKEKLHSREGLAVTPVTAVTHLNNINISIRYEKESVTDVVTDFEGVTDVEKGGR